jgi:hypothetical protein
MSLVLLLTLLLLASLSPSLSLPVCPSFPRYALVGAQKSGTTTVHFILSSCVKMCYYWKEIHAFDLYEGRNTGSLVGSHHFPQISANIPTYPPKMTPAILQELCETFQVRTFRNVNISASPQVEEAETEKHVPSNPFHSPSTPPLFVMKEADSDLLKNGRPCLSLDATPVNGILDIAEMVFSAYSVKRFAILRDPLDRIVSEINMRRTRCEIPCAQYGRKLSLELSALKSGQKVYRNGSQVITQFRTTRVIDYLHRSMYDKMISLHRLKPSSILLFSWLLSNCTYLSSRLIEILHLPRSLLPCMTNSCSKSFVFSNYSGNTRNYCPETCKRDVIPKEVEEFIRQQNPFYYEHLHKIYPYDFPPQI